MSSINLMDAVLRSVRVAALCTVVGMPVSVALGWLLARRNFLGKTLVSGLVMAPMVMPPVVTGLLLLDLFGRRSWLGSLLSHLGIEVAFTELGAVVAAVVVGLPMGVQVVRHAFDAVDPRLEDMALTLGDTRFRSFVRVTLPLATPGIVAAVILFFARALGEFGATVVVAGNTEGHTRTIALAVYALLDEPDGDAAARTMAIACVLVAVCAMVGYEALSRWQRRRLDLDRGN